MRANAARGKPSGSIQPKRSHWVFLGATVAWIVIAAFLYPPWPPRPFDIVDFPQFIPLLRAHDSFVSKYRAVAELYASEGRMSLLAYAALAAKSQLFGERVIGWQLVRFGQMLAIGALLFALLRRWGASRAGAYCATSLILASQGAAIAWVRLNMSEPLGFVLLLLMLLVATREPRRIGRYGSLILIAILAAATLLMKEMLVATLPAVVWAYASFRRDGEPRRMTLDRRVWECIVVLTLVASSILVPVAQVALSSPARAYARQFGGAPIDPSNFLFAYAGIFLPFPPQFTAASPVVVVALGIYLLLVILGARMFLAQAASRSHARNLVALGLIFPLLGVAAYSPWPDFKLLYGIPYLLGPAVLIALAISGAQGAGILRLRWPWLLLGITFLPMFASALSYSRRTDVILRLSRAMVERATKLPPELPLEVAVCDHAQSDWRNFGAMLGFYGRAMALAVPRMIDVSCSEAQARVRAPKQSRSTLIISPRRSALPPSPISLNLSAWTLAYPALRIRREELSAVIVSAIP